jgi:hypothetical protein
MPIVCVSCLNFSWHEDVTSWRWKCVVIKKWYDLLIVGICTSLKLFFLGWKNNIFCWDILFAKLQPTKCHFSHMVEVWIYNMYFKKWFITSIQCMNMTIEDKTWWSQYSTWSWICTLCGHLCMWLLKSWKVVGSCTIMIVGLGKVWVANSIWSWF